MVSNSVRLCSPGSSARSLLVANFKNLDVFHKAHSLALNVIQVSVVMRGPVGLAIKGQMVRAALSVPTNIVEGSAKGSDHEFARFAYIAMGSLSELEYHLIVAKDITLVTERDFNRLTEKLIDIRKMLTGLHRRLKSSAETPVARKQIAASRSAGSRRRVAGRLP